MMQEEKVPAGSFMLLSKEGREVGGGEQENTFIWSMGVGKYCFPSASYKNKTVVGQDMPYVLLIPTCQEGTERGRKCGCTGGLDKGGWETAYQAQCLLACRALWALAGAPSAQVPVPMPEQTEALDPLCLLMESPV